MNNSYEFLAILGACAWIPPLIQLIIKLFTKPKLTIICHKQVEIGYTVNGPILNLGIALSAENTECLVTNIQIYLQGPNSDQHMFSWQWFEEKLYEIDYSEIGTTPVKKKQDAIAIKILKENLVEKKIGYHKQTFKTSYNEAYASTIQLYELLVRNNQDTQALKATEEYDKFNNLLQNSLIWIAGEYTASIKVKVLNLDNNFTKDFKFRLSQNDIRRLQSNIEVCTTSLEVHFFPNEEKFDPIWNWVYANVTSI